MKYTAMELSKHIVTKCQKDNYPINNFYLQKLLVYIQKEFLSNGSAVFHDTIEYWSCGPVVPNVYYHFCGFGIMPITLTFDETIKDERVLRIIDKIVEEKRVLPIWNLKGFD